MTSSPVFLLLIGFPLKLKCAQLLLELQVRVCLRFWGFCVMATPRRIQLTTPSHPVSLHSAGNNLSGTGFLHTQGLFNPPAPPCQAERTLSARMELVLFEPDDARCAEFHYPELSAVRGKGGGETLREMMEEGKGGDGDEDELQVLATMFQKKYGGAPKPRRDRVQDLVDMGDGYDDTDSFIDNSEAYDELVPACLTTKYGGFYINVGTLQFRQASGEENETDDFEENVQPQKRKLKEGGKANMNMNRKKRKEDVQPKGESTKHSVPKNELRKQQYLDGMLRKFHKEKLQELQLFNTTRKESPPGDNRDSTTPAEPVSTDPPPTLVDGASADEFHHAVMEQDELLMNDPDQETRDETSRASVPDGSPPTQGRVLQELTRDDQLTVLIRRLEEAVFRVMPEQIERFNDHCQAHSEARAAKLEAVKERRAVEGSDEQEDDSSGKRLFAPRKRFRWNEEIRESLCEVVRMKMSSYALDAPGNQSLEGYLKGFLEARVKTLWPRGWMQSRILLIESRRVHAHVTGVVARKKSAAGPKPEKCEENVAVRTGPGNQARSGAKRTCLGFPTSASRDVKINVGVFQPIRIGLSFLSARKVPVACGDVSVLQRRPAEEKEPRDVSAVERDVYFPPSLLCGAVAAMEGSCGDPALPTPSLSHQTWSPRSAPQSRASATPLHALPFPGLPRDDDDDDDDDGKPAGHTEICRTSVLTSAAPGTFQLSHDGSQNGAGGPNAPRKPH
ncbi:ubinuclein-1 isoform X2 [Ictalurus furcatus]|uniref:ubinuclein-1 isoform X2 n=1 Tax=Ictalurus furcatus TaxID=66913 RepID=UPI00234FC277|nr:ubinuclein-1 isoform X2 [Ictalurus furcatus]